MQLYFVKATYTNNVYKISDFFLSGSYKLVAGKMIDINFRPDDGISSFITKNIKLPDNSLIREHTHIIVPEFNKIYRITAIDYLNKSQAMIYLDEDPLIGNYLELEGTNFLLNRSNDPDNFRGVNDIADLTLKESVAVKSVSTDIRSGKWALLFFQFNESDPVIGLRFDNAATIVQHIVVDDIAELLADYPEVETLEPELVDYFQEVAYVIDTGITYQCIWSTLDGAGLKWAVYNDTASDVVYFNASDVVIPSLGVNPIKINKTDVLTYCIALPFETDLFGEALSDKNILSYDRFIGPVDASLIDIKIVNDILIPQQSQQVDWNLTTRISEKRIVFTRGLSRIIPTYTDVSTTTLNIQNMVTLSSFNFDIDVSLVDSTPTPTNSEPFKKYDLYIFGKKYNIPHRLAHDIHLLIALNSGVINYILYFEDKRNILASGSFTHSIKYNLDGLDAFYSQNPTYKDQFFTKMATDSIKTIAAGAIGGSVIPGVGTLAGAGIGVLGAGVDAGLGMINLAFQEKSLRMKPDQVFGENSDVTLQQINIFGIYWVVRTSKNVDLMYQEYSLRGFPIAITLKISDLGYSLGGLGSLPYDGLSKIVYGEIKIVIKNEYTTAFINSKLKEGIVLIA